MKDAIAKSSSVLIVDDEPLLLGTTRDFLEPSFAKVWTATTPAEALHIAKTQSIDILLVDHRMPQMRGTELLKRVREIIPELPVIMITAYPDDDDVIHAFMTNDFDVIEKPYKPEILLQRIKVALAAPFLAEVVAALGAQIKGGPDWSKLPLSKTKPDAIAGVAVALIDRRKAS